MKITKLEAMMMNGMRRNEYNDAIDCGTWTFTAIDNSGVTNKQASGVISSLVKKGLVAVDAGDPDDSRDSRTIAFTELGKKIFLQADGEKCNWSNLGYDESDKYPNLLREEPQIIDENVGEVEVIETTEETKPEPEETPVVVETPRLGRKTKKIEVLKDGEVVKTLDSLTETLKWAVENKVANVGWVKESLRSGRETTPGRKFTEGGYKFQYVK